MVVAVSVRVRLAVLVKRGRVVRLVMAAGHVRVVPARSCTPNNGRRHLRRHCQDVPLGSRDGKAKC